MSLKYFFAERGPCMNCVYFRDMFVQYVHKSDVFQSILTSK